MNSPTRNFSRGELKSSEKVEKNDIRKPKNIEFYKSYQDSFNLYYKQPL